MLPAVIPLVSVLWKRIKKIIHGRRPSKADALDVVTSILCCPCRMAMASGTVQRELETSRIIGRKNSFQVQIKKNTNSTESVGILIGVIMRNSNCTLLQPSIIAASIISRGNWLNTEDNKYVPKALWITVNTRITANRVLYRLKNLAK